MNLEQIRNEVVRVIGLDNTASGPDETLVDQWASAAVLDVLLETRCYVRPVVMETTAEEADYDLPASILHVVDAYATDSAQTYRMKQASPVQINDMRVTSNVQQDAPATHFAVAGSNLLMLYPTPPSVYELTFYYVPRPTAMSFDAHDPSDTVYGGVPVEFHRAIVKYACAEAADYRDDQTSQHGDRYRAAYERELAKIRKAVNQKGHTETAAFELAGRSYPPHDPSTDLR
jgi:hypothetical protein